MDVDELERIINLLERSSITEFQLEQEGKNLRISRAVGTVGVQTRVLSGGEPLVAEAMGAAAQAAGAAAAEEGLVRIESPIVGNYYSRPSPEADPFVHVGSHVKKGDTLCIVEAMKLMNEIEATVSGTIEKIFLSDGQVVEYGEVLFLIRPD